ncbi:MAG: T9SS type A sorting domain-containing protein [Flavobacterium sp.]|nr:T9SS type A sorting domain-containing protein [Flavobacterium sp.]
MKTKLLLLFLLGQITLSNAQNIAIDQITPTIVDGGINVNLLVTTFNGAGYLSNSYEVTGNTINLSVCYWFSAILPVFQMSNDFFIPLTEGGLYTINVRIFHSASTTTCDFFSAGPIGTVVLLSNNTFENVKKQPELFPNPTSGIIEINFEPNEINAIQIWDSMGRLIKEIKERSTNRINLSDLTNGIYWIKIATSSGNSVHKVIIQR